MWGVRELPSVREKILDFDFLCLGKIWRKLVLRLSGRWMRSDGQVWRKGE
jgi:hypothetical protein